MPTLLVTTQSLASNVPVRFSEYVTVTVEPFVATTAELMVGGVVSPSAELFVILALSVWLSALFGVVAASFTELPTPFVAV